MKFRAGQLRIGIRAVFYKEGRVWFAHCLEMDVVGHGTDKSSALSMLNEVIFEQVCMSLKHNNPADIFQPADAKYFEMYAAGKDAALHGHLITQSRPPKDADLPSTVVFDDFEAREYAAA